MYKYNESLCANGASSQISEFVEPKKSISTAISDAIRSLETVTKVLKLQKVSKACNKRKLVISSNWLKAFRFEKGTPVVEEVLGDLQGMQIRLADSSDTSVKKVYERSYASRSNEVQTDTRNQAKINKAFGWCEYVHITFTQGVLHILPVFSNADEYKGDPVTLNLENNVEGLDTTIFNALDYIEQFKARTVFIESQLDDYVDTKQAMLLALQLRRMGYSVHFNEDSKKSIVAKMSTDETSSKSSYKVDVHQLSLNTEFKQKVLSKVTKDNITKAFFMFSSGVDMYAMAQEGIVPTLNLDYRPIENRDIRKRNCPVTGDVMDFMVDKTELGAACSAINCGSLRAIFNEDIYTFKFNRVKKAIKSIGPVGVVHSTILCDDFSLCKNEADRKRAIDDLSTTIDAFIPTLRNFKLIEAPILNVENVAGFMHDPIIFGLTEAYLEHLGFKVSASVLNALDYNGYSSRKRMMLCATLLDVPFSMPQKQKRRAHLWNDYLVDNLHRFRDVSHTQIAHKVRDGKNVFEFVKAHKIDIKSLSRKEQVQYRKYMSSNWIEEGAEYCGTIVKSQARQVSESLHLEFNGQVLFPDNEVIRTVMGVDENFKISPFLTKEEACEILGQSVDIPMHKAFTREVIAHIERYLGFSLGSSELNVSKDNVDTDLSIKQFEQYSLFN